MFDFASDDPEPDPNADKSQIVIVSYMVVLYYYIEEGDKFGIKLTGHDFFPFLGLQISGPSTACEMVRMCLFALKNYLARRYPEQRSLIQQLPVP